jgi:glutathione synthase/RimK-type ligase-like ATP-grasp enzyme
MILAIGNSGSFEVAAFTLVVDALKQRGQDALLFKQDKCLEGEYLIFEVCGGIPHYYIIIDGRRYNIDDFSAIWYLKPHLPKELLEYKPVEHRSFISRQFEEMRRALWSLFRYKKWLNDPWAMLIAENKLYQLQIATLAKFSIPETIITSDPNEIRAFYEKNNGDIIVKLLAVSPIPNKVIYTNRVTPEHMRQIDSIKMSPSIFQAYIKKDYELRITVVGDKIFPVKIHSQECEDTAIDWRRKPKPNDFEAKMEPVLLPDKIEENIRNLMGLLSLKFGCIDMIVTPDGEYVFLEINPNGQWYFVQLESGLQIAEAIAELLTD